jgi:hypothetical protein
VVLVGEGGRGGGQGGEGLGFVVGWGLCDEGLG